MNIYYISEKYISVAHKIERISREKGLKGKLKRELSDLSHQCYLASESIIRDFTDEGIAIDNLLNILGRFNDIVQDD
jgi:hypothetical protein